MNRIDRLTAILVHLQGKPRVPLEELECRFEVSRRTIFRDIKALLEAGVPIGGDAGEGYFIVEGYHLPPVVFNKEEAGAIVLAAKLIEQHADMETNRIFDEAMHKIRAVLKYKDREYLQKLEESVAVVRSPAVLNMGFPESHIAEIQEALAAQKVLLISYFSNYREEVSSRQVEPLGLVYYSARWHLIGFCRLRRDFRDFRTDRIQKLHITHESFDRAAHPSFQHFLDNMLGGTDANEAVLVFSKRVSRYIQDQKYYYGFVEEQRQEAGVQMKFVTPSYDFLARWLLMYGNEVQVVSPAELRDRMANLSLELFEHHHKKIAVTEK